MKTNGGLIGVVILAALSAIGCGAGANANVTRDEGPPSLDVTHWTDKTELFMEYPALVAGQTALFAVHVTRLDDFKPVATGQVKLELVPESGGSATVLAASKPSRPGAFRLEGAAPAAGRYRWALAFDSPGLVDRHDLGIVTVFADDASARADSASRPPEDAAAIAYLKEQQWTNAFKTAPVQQADVRASILVPATVRAIPGGEVVVAAPAAGRLMADALPSIGTRVSAGQVLARIEPRLASGTDRATLTAEVAEAQATLDAAKIEQARAERLLAERAVPSRRVEDARRALLVAEARLRAAEARLAQRDDTLQTGGGSAAGNAYLLRAPINGRIAEATATLGALYEEGARLFRLVRTDRVELELQVPPASVPAARQAVGLALMIPDRPELLPLEPRQVRDAGVVDPTTRALPVRMEIDNPGEQLLIGQAATAVLYTRNQRQVPAVPGAAVLMEAGRPYVFVQVGGERFVRRFITIAARDGDLVGVESGLAPGQRVVTMGAYEVQLASAATGLAAEGHVH